MHFEEKLNSLRLVLSKTAVKSCFALAFSGGLDSRFLAFASRQLGFNPQLCHISGPHVDGFETQNAKSWAAGHGFFLKEIAVNPLENSYVASNDKRRCYFCKHLILRSIIKETTLPVCDGSNVSDASVYRPGRQALQELGIYSPLELAGFDKQDIRAVAAYMGMDNPEQKARPCLLTRFPYGFPLDNKHLVAIAKGESTVRAVLQKFGVHNADFRLRCLSENSVQLHILQSDFARFGHEILAELEHALSAKFPSFAIVPQESLSGFFDRS